MRDSEVGEKRPDWAEWNEVVLEVELRRELVQVGGAGAVSVGCGGGLTRSGRVFGPSALKDILRAFKVCSLAGPTMLSENKELLLRG